MSLLPLTALPYIPTAFVPGDWLTYAGKAYERTESGTWESPGFATVTDIEMREMYIDPEHLAAFGVPLLVPAPVETDEALPGRRVAEGDDPFRDGPYLMAGQQGREFKAASDHGPWGIAQRACTPNMAHRPADFEGEMTVTDTGRVWLRAHGIPLAFIPADLPTESEIPPLIEAAALHQAFPPGPWR
ncbi:hypothetical protein [Streptomyces chartreusis]|uniref:hypothetical protein n=1 Tax=Streptomyces chartreusis TaxID=1969 RepID=UPI003D765EE7